MTEKTPETTTTANPFETSLQKLEQIVKKLESGQITLEESLNAFQEGVQLVKTCQETLSQAEQRVEQLVKASTEGVETKPITRN